MNTANNVSDALKRVIEAKTPTALEKKLKESGIYRDASEIEIADFTPKYLDYDRRSDAQLRREAAEHAERIYSPKVEALELNSDGKQKSLNAELLKTEADRESTLKELKDDYGRAVLSAADRAVRNGVVTSTILSDMLSAAKNDYFEKTAAAETGFSVKTERIKSEIAVVEQQKRAALMEYDLKKAAEYEKKLSALREEQQRTNQMVGEYNSRLKEFEKNYEENLKRTLEEWKKAIADGNVD